MAKGKGLGEGFALPKKSHPPFRFQRSALYLDTIARCDTIAKGIDTIAKEWDE
jgi:hypothetical protein